MQFKKVRVLIKHNVMNSTAVTVFQHEIPILQARFGRDKVTPQADIEGCGLAMVDKVTDKRDEHNQPIVIKVPLERSLDEEWDRLMDKPPYVQISENDKRPAPAVAFPLGVRDLEDFYRRIAEPTDNVVPMSKRATTEDVTETSPESPAPDDEIPLELSPREQLKSDLDDMGIEYKGNAKTVDLQSLYDEVSNNNVSTDIQN